MRKFTKSLIVLVVALIGTLSTMAQTAITSPFDIRQDRVYQISTARYALDAHNFNLLNEHVDDYCAALGWAIYSYDNGGLFVIYDPDSKKFLSKSADGRAELTDEITTVFDIVPSMQNNDCFSIENRRYNYQMYIDDGTLKISYQNRDDENSQFKVAEVGTLSASDQNAIKDAIERHKGSVLKNQINSLSELSNNKTYYIFNNNGTLACKKEYDALYWTGKSSSDITDGQKKFAIIKSERGNYYLYSPFAKRFMGGGNEKTPGINVEPNVAGKIIEADEYYKIAEDLPWIFALNGNNIGIEANSIEGMPDIVYTDNNPKDGRSAMGIQEAGDFDPTAVLELINKFETENAVNIESMPEDGGTSFYLPTLELQFNSNMRYFGGITVKKDGVDVTESIKVEVKVNDSKVTIDFSKKSDDPSIDGLPVCSEGVYTIHIPASALLNHAGLSLDKDIDFTKTVISEIPVDGLKVVDVTPSDILNENMKLGHFPEDIVITFNHEVSIDESKSITLSTPHGPLRGAQVIAMVSDQDPTKVIIKTLDAMITAHYTLSIPENMFVDKDGKGNEAIEFKVYAQNQPTIFMPKDEYPFIYEPVNELNQIVLIFANPVGFVRQDKVAEIVVIKHNNQGMEEEIHPIQSVEFPSTFNDEPNYFNVVITLNPIKEAGSYKFIIPEGLVYNEFGDQSLSDYGESLGANYNGTLAITYTIDTATGIATVKTTSNDGKTIYNLNGVKVNKPTTKGVFIINGKKAIVK